MSAIPWATVEDALWAWVVSGSGLASDHVVWGRQTAPRPVGEFISMRMTVVARSARDWRAREDNVVTVGPLPVSARTGNSLTVVAHGLVTGQGPVTFTTTGTLPGGISAQTNYWPIAIDANTLQFASSFQLAIAATPTAITLTSAGTGTITLAGATFIPGLEILSKLRGPRKGVLTLQCFAGAPTGGAPTGATAPMNILHDAISALELEALSAALSAAGIGIMTVDPIMSIDGVVNSVRFEPRAVVDVHLHLASELVETSTYIQIVNATDQIPSPSVVISSVLSP